MSPDTPGIFQFHADGLELIGVAGAAHAHVHPAIAHYVQVADLAATCNGWCTGSRTIPKPSRIFVVC